MAKNEFSNITVTMPLDDIPEHSRLQLTGCLSGYRCWYRWELSQNVETGCRYLSAIVCTSNDSYNMIPSKHIVDTVLRLQGKTVKVVYHDIIAVEQPPLNIILAVMQPYIHKLASVQHSHWKQLEWDDLVQTCYMCVCKLYSQGYVISTQLINTTFAREVLQSLRKDRDAPTVLSLDYLQESDDDSYGSVIDNVEDEQATADMTEMEDSEAAAWLIHAQRDIIVEQLGIRQYDQLLREYSNKQTTVWSRKKLSDLKKYVASIGLDDKSFDYLK